ncbi:anoctamin-1-like protein, partial [Leptotrombidium deliense]
MTIDKVNMNIYTAQMNDTRYSPTATEIEMEGVGENERRERAMSFFEDGHKTVDFIIVNDTKKEEHEKQEEYRQYYEDNLREEGLQLEETENNASRLRYLKIHAPWEVLSRYAEIMKLKMPMKHVENAERVILDEDDPFCKERFTIPYSRDKEYLFNIPEQKEKFFSTSQRALIVDFILRRKHFCPRTDDASAFGINKLVQDGVYCAAYPLHDGKLTEGADPNSPRMNLSTNWASLSMMFRQQPLDEVKSYFGVKVALYYAWLGFYTDMLIPASIVGLICFFYGIIMVSSDVPSQQICNHTFDAFPMCPLCVMPTCKFWNISRSCKYSKMSYVFDNPATVFFAVFMSIWSTVYLEMWKRYSAKITFRWDLSAFDSVEQVPRPEYLARLSKSDQKRLNAITNMYEPYLPFWRKKLPYTVLSGVSVLLLVLVAFSALIG